MGLDEYCHMVDHIKYLILHRIIIICLKNKNKKNVN